MTDVLVSKTLVESVVVTLIVGESKAELPASLNGQKVTVLSSVARLVLVHSAPAALRGFHSLMSVLMHFVSQLARPTKIAARLTCVPTSDKPNGRVRRANFFFVSAFCLCLFGSVACDDACKALAERICECEPNRASQLSCEDAILSSSTREISPEEIEVCEQKLDSCTCAKLEDQDLQACGLAK